MDGPRPVPRQTGDGEVSKWLERTLLQGPYLALATSPRQFKELVRGMDLELPEIWLRPQWNACTHSWEKGSEILCIVCIDLKRSLEVGPTHAAALLAHEAVHVWQRARDRIGGDIGDEMEAYAVQNICQSLFDAYVKELERK